MSGEPDNTQTK